MARKQPPDEPAPTGWYIEPLLPGVSHVGRSVAAALIFLGRSKPEFEASDDLISLTLKHLHKPNSGRFVQKGLKELRDRGHVETASDGGSRTVRLLFRLKPTRRMGGGPT